jgi:hypothetical protein
MLLLIATESKEVIDFAMGFKHVENCFQQMPVSGSMGREKSTHG